MEVTWNIPKQLLDTEVDATIVDMEVNSKGLNLEVEANLKELGVTNEPKALRVWSRAYFGSPGHKAILMLLEQGLGVKLSASEKNTEKTRYEYRKAIGNVVKVKLMQSESKSKTQYCVVTSFNRDTQFFANADGLMAELKSTKAKLETLKNGLKCLGFTFNGDRLMFGSDVLVDFRFPGTKNIPIVSATRKIQY